MTEFLTTFAEGLAGLTGLSPSASIIGLGFLIALVPVIQRGRLDDRVETFFDEIDYASGILTVTFLYAYYLEFGTEFGTELIAISGGFIIGTFVQRSATKIAGFN
jgi:hypothetical protein